MSVYKLISETMEDMHCTLQFVLGQPFVKRFALCCRTVVCAVCPVFR